IEISSTITLFNRRFNDHFNIPEIQFVNAVKPFSKPCSIPPKNDFLLICDSLPKREYSHGTIVNDTRNESNVETMTVTQNWRKISETKPDRSEEHTSELQS